MKDLPVLKAGDSGTAVDLFRLLTIRGSGPLPTLKVQEWQILNGLKGDGVVGPKTWAVILGVAAVGILAFTGDTANISPVTRRERLIQKALGELGVQNPDKYWTDANTALVGSGLDWCGAFTLSMLHSVGLGRDIRWKMGDGYLFRLPTTKNPQPGDMLYIDQPFQHQAIVSKIVGDRVFSIDGNQRGETVGERERLLKDITAFYSIEPLLRA